MKRTAREKNTIIISFVFYFILVASITLFILLNTLNVLGEINNKKLETQKIYDENEAIKKVWISFEEFKSLSNASDINTIKSNSEILKNISKEFYEKNLKNDSDKSFDEFINKKITELKSDDNTKLIKDNNRQIINILPIYSENNIDTGESTLSDYQFINYVESIIESFNLTTGWSIGIWNLVLLKDYAVSSDKWNTLESNLYAIPLSLNVKWTKSNILDFLYFVQNVWNIKVFNNMINIVRDDWTLSINGFPKVLAGDKYYKWYNIFENQIIDISNISMPDYIDSSYVPRKDKALVDFIKEEEGNDMFEVKVNLNFYVKWQPKSEVLNFINNVFLNFKLINAKVNKMISSWKIKWAELIKLKKKQNLLKNINSKIVSIKTELRKQKELDPVYRKTIEINEFIIWLCDDFEWTCKNNIK